MRSAAVLAFGLVAVPVLAQQELPLNRTTPIEEQLARTTLDTARKEAVQHALDKHDYTAAETVLVNAISENPKSADLLLLAARVFLLDHNPMNAAIALKKAEKIAPLAPADRFNLAMAYLGIKRGEWARPELETLAAANPKNPLYDYWLARIDYDERKYDASVERLRAVTKTVPDFTRAWDNLGLSLEALGKLDEAVASYREAARLNRTHSPHLAWPPLNLATLLTKMGQLKDAEQFLREAVSYEPALGEARYRLGVNLHKQARDDEAITELREATRLDPNAPEPLYTLGQIYREKGDTQAAEQAFERFRALKKKQRGS